MSRATETHDRVLSSLPAATVSERPFASTPTSCSPAAPGDRSLCDPSMPHPASSRCRRRPLSSGCPQRSQPSFHTFQTKSPDSTHAEGASRGDGLKGRNRSITEAIAINEGRVGALHSCFGVHTRNRSMPRHSAHAITVARGQSDHMRPFGNPSGLHPPSRETESLAAGERRIEQRNRTTCETPVATADPPRGSRGADCDCSNSLLGSSRLTHFTPRTCRHHTLWHTRNLYAILSKSPVLLGGPSEQSDLEHRCAMCSATRRLYTSTPAASIARACSGRRS